ncbi:MAG: TIGR02300 family protein [Pseudomonadota bacterium]
MSKPELGVKRDCPECGARFYDLGKDPADCPKCSATFSPEDLLKPRRSRAKAEENEKEATENEKSSLDEEEGLDAEPAVALEDADEEAEGAKSARAAALDEDEEESETDSGEDIPDIEGIEDIDIDNDDDTLLEDDDEDSGVGDIITRDDDT